MTAHERLYAKLLNVQTELQQEKDQQAEDILCDEILDQLWAQIMEDGDSL